MWSWRLAVGLVLEVVEMLLSELSEVDDKSENTGVGSQYVVGNGTWDV